MIGVTEPRVNQLEIRDFNPTIPNYTFENVPTPLAAGGVGMYIHKFLNYKIIGKCTNEAFPALWIEVILTKHANIICGIIHRQHNSPERFQIYFEEMIEKLTAAAKSIYVMGDFNINLLRCETCYFAPHLLTIYFLAMLMTLL